MARRNLTRGIKFLVTLSGVPEIRAALDEGAGYTEQDHAEGWQLLLTAMGYRGAAVSTSSSSIPQQTALAEVDDWDGLAFERARATLQYAFPGQLEYVFNNLNAGTGTNAIGSTETFLVRVVALRDGTDPDREATRDEDRQAVERLAERKIFTPEIQAHLEALLDQAKQLAPAPTASVDDDEVQATADELHVWLLDWSGQARAFITRGDYLIRLVLSSPRTHAHEDEEVGDQDVGNQSASSAAAANAARDVTAA